MLGAAGDADAPPPLTVLWITPLRALAADTGLALARAARALQPHWTVDVRTGDTAASARARQMKRLPTALVTTPESLTLMLARADWRERLAHLSAVIVDEWHELMSSKRGVQVELALARLRGLRPALRCGDCPRRSPISMRRCVPDRRARRGRAHRQGTGGQDDRDRHRASAHHRPLSVGGAHRT